MESWFQRKNQSPKLDSNKPLHQSNVKSNQNIFINQSQPFKSQHRHFGDANLTRSTTDQGPYQFRQILKPANSACHINRQENYQDSNSDEFPFDFRKLLRKTNHAPTDTLKRCKGMITSND